MSPVLLLTFVALYFLILLVVAWYTSRNSNNDSFFIGNRNSNWMLVAFGMIGTSLSGVTFVSVPGTVGAGAFGYFQVVLGYFIGYFIVAFILLPLYYRLNLTSIYSYLQSRFGITSYKTGALFFIISRTLGATARLYLVINVLQIFILDNLGVPFGLTAFIILLMILLYTFEGGVKTIVFTDTLQTTFMLLGLVVCVFYIMGQLSFSFAESMTALEAKQFTKIFNTDVNSAGFWLKQIAGGAFITIGMTGLDQEMMQKNISVKNLGDSKKNMITFSVVLVVVNFLFLLLGGLLYLFAENNGLAVKGDDLFPTVALSHVPAVISIIFIIGLISALFPSADGALTALTSSFCIDIIGLKRRADWDEAKRKTVRLTVHITFAVIFFLLILLFKFINNKSIIDIILKVAGFTYGPLLGLFCFGIFTKRQINDSKAIWVCLAAPLIILGIDFVNNIEWYARQLKLAPETMQGIQQLSENVFGKFKIGYELLIYNGLLTYVGLMLISKRQSSGDAPLTNRSGNDA
ncbi:sodium:solute symporter [Foetidibacter luteolus]|uniref:sodium:solute symporter n=1 Tax=Foetidibacter luteolus TaxID=2608880 RepID=UPI00129BF0E8|nr:sodium:solute symporter [Foetidibacter luteolus]